MNALLPTLLWLPALASAQLHIRADVDKTEVAVNDQLVLEVTVNGPEANLPEPRMPNLPNFSVYSSGRNQSLSIVNGKVSSSIVHTYVLAPRFVGQGSIGPIEVQYQGKTFRTEPIQIQVVRPAAGSSPSAQGQPGRPSRPRAAPEPDSGRELFVTAELDKKRAFVNEQVTLSVRFYTSVNLLGNPQYVAPSLSGFIAEDLPPERHGNVMIRGRMYYFSEIKTALFPAQSGPLRVGAALVRAPVQGDLAVDPFAADFFERFLSMSAPKTAELTSEPIVLNAEPLPEQGKPPGFSGAVGLFLIAAATDRQRAKAGEAVNLTVTLQGTGNLKALGEPVMPDLSSFRVFDTVSSLNLDKKQDLVKGSKVFKTVLVAKASGDISIGPISFSYFDPQSRSYKTVQTDAIRLKIDPAPEGSQPAAMESSGPRGLTAVSRDIRYLKAPRSRSLGRWLEHVANAGPIHSLPFAIFAGFLCAFQIRARRQADPAAARAAAAVGLASRRISEAVKEGDSRRSAALMSAALTGYLADKLNCSASGLTFRRAQELLRQRSSRAPQSLMEDLRRLWEQIDRLSFAPQTDGEDQAGLASALGALLKDLEKELKR
ncbi:MAG: protein BatD [Elusimicrobia bacterium]|nr:protein BatD [Elusimicrobiota bacterium]